VSRDVCSGLAWPKSERRNCIKVWKFLYPREKSWKKVQ